MNYVITKYTKYITLLFFVLSCLSFAFTLRSAYYSCFDFKTLTDVSRCLLNGYDIYDSNVINKFKILPTYEPSCYLFLMPFLFVSWEKAKLLWIGLNIVLTVLLVKDITELYLEKKHFPYLLGLVILSQPWRTHMHVGQCVIWSLYFFVLSIKLEKKGMTVRSGLALTLSLFKFHLIIPMLLFFVLYKRKWKNVLIASAFQFIILLIISAYVKASPVQLLLGPLKYTKTLTGKIETGYLDVFAFWGRLIDSSTSLSILSGLIIITVLIHVLLNKNIKDELGILTITSMISSILMYHRSYDYLVIVFSFSWILNSRNNINVNLVAFSIGVYLVGFCSFHYFEYIPSLQYIAELMQGTYFLTILSISWYLSIFALISQMKKGNVKCE